MNKTMSRKEYYDMIDAVALGKLEIISYVDRLNYVLYRGNRIIRPRYSDQFVFFEQCEYCGNTALDRNECCASCGAPAYR